MDGFININKPSGITSYDVIRFLKKRFHIQEKIGHTGTLDPLASGVLVICIGKATKSAPLFLEMEKEYLATMRLGLTTDTDDSEGKVLSTASWEGITEEEIYQAATRFSGKISQIPPVVSAIRVGGTRLYALHRKGQKVTPPKKTVTIYRLHLTQIKLPFISFEVTCSRGTYIRALCRDIGAALGCGGTQTALIRKRVGSFTLDQSVSLEIIEQTGMSTHLIPLGALSQWKKNLS
ncbi:MAG: tRNA pseudouridine(55) synthase TruB [Candidatus Ratteibacteria bacterium]|jgi:tRNA pseudouridine55 synthase